MGDLSGVRDDEENGKSKNWGKHSNWDLHSWAFDRLSYLLTYKAEMEEVEVLLEFLEERLY
nr:hypothetical protein [Haloarchaeobius litoreus]